MNKPSDFGRPCVIEADIVKVSTGEIRTYIEEDEGDHDEKTRNWRLDEGGDIYLWSEGNYSCDCNRALFFARAAGEDEPDEPCGDSAYRLISLRQNGIEIYREETN